MKTYLLLLAFLGTCCYAQQPLTPEQQEELERNRRSDVRWDKFVRVEKSPEVLNLHEVSRKMKYPEKAKRQGIEGKVLIRILIDTTGVPIKTDLAKSANEMFTEEVMKYIYSLRFEPAILHGKPIFFWTVVPFDFSLKKTTPAQPQKP